MFIDLGTIHPKQLHHYMSNQNKRFKLLPVRRAIYQVFLCALLVACDNKNNKAPQAQQQRDTAALFNLQ